MRKILIATHGSLAESFIETAELIVGSHSNISSFCMTKEKSANTAKEELANLLRDSSQKDRHIVLTDVLGGSVANILTELLMAGGEFDLVTGVNLPMLLTLLLGNQGNEDFIEDALRESRDGILYVNGMINDMEANDTDDIIIED